jgi:hypothetical protein
MTPSRSWIRKFARRFNARSGAVERARCICATSRAGTVRVHPFRMPYNLLADLDLTPSGVNCVIGCPGGPEPRTAKVIGQVCLWSAAYHHRHRAECIFRSMQPLQLLRSGAPSGDVIARCSSFNHLLPGEITGRGSFI